MSLLLLSLKYLDTVKIRSLSISFQFFQQNITSVDKFNVCRLFSATVLIVGTALLFMRGNTTRYATTRIPRAVFCGSHSGLTALKFPRAAPLKYCSGLNVF